MSIAETLDTMEYGPAPESDGDVRVALSLLSPVSVFA